MAEITENEWQTGMDPGVLIWAVYRSSPRKERLFCSACCRRIWDLLPSADLHSAVAVAEQFVDGMATDHMLADAHNRAYSIRVSLTDWGAEAADAVRAATKPQPDMSDCRTYAESVRGCHAYDTRYTGANSNESVEDMYAAQTGEWAVQTMLLRDIFGNPFRPVAFDSAWRTSTAIALAQQLYDSRDFGLMPILADALQDAGCDSDDVLAHCRDATGTHVRGCWVVDLVLGKS